MRFAGRSGRGVGRAVCILAGTLALACTSAPEHLPPRSPPPREVPPVPLPAAPLAAGYGRVVLHGTDGPMRVTAEAEAAFVPPGGHAPASRTGSLCATTPCVVDLPVGRYTLYLSSADGAFKHGDTDALEVTEGLTYYVRAPGRYESPTWFPALPTVLVITAAALITTGTVIAVSQDDGARAAGYAAIAGGVAVGTWGSIEAYDASRAKEQPGATTTWKW
jgi:hypothetical protein